jgi:hypothetical protein
LNALGFSVVMSGFWLRGVTNGFRNPQSEMAQGASFAAPILEPVASRLAGLRFSQRDQSFTRRGATSFKSVAKALKSALRGEVLRQASPISRLGSGGAKRDRRMSLR